MNQRGSVSKKKRAEGLTWIFRYQVNRVEDNKRVERTAVIGLVSKIGNSRKAAETEAVRLGYDRLLDNPTSTVSPTFRQLANHFREHELDSNGLISGRKAHETKGSDRLYLDSYILPRWGNEIAIEITPMAIENWFEVLATTPQGRKQEPLEWTTVVKIKALMNQIFKHAQRQRPRMFPDETPPSVQARCTTTSNYEARIVTTEQMIVILSELDSDDTRMEWMLALLDAATALRPEECFGLKWCDVDWDGNNICLNRAWSKGKETSGKVAQAMTGVPLHAILAEALKSWRRESLYPQDSDWIFPSYKLKGQKPRSASQASKDYLRPAAVKAGVIAERDSTRFGWHNLRHSLASYFASTGASTPQLQKLLRHSNPKTSAKYIHAVNSSQVEDQGMYLAKLKVSASII
jgi:integrase